jgi:hypothetical protein
MLFSPTQDAYPPISASSHTQCKTFTALTLLKTHGLLCQSNVTVLTLSQSLYPIILQLV